MTVTEKTNRPGDMHSTEAVQRNCTDPSTTANPTLTSEEIAVALPVYVLIVKTPTDRITRRVYLSLHSAVKATERAQARGHAASLELARYEGGGAR